MTAFVFPGQGAQVRGMARDLFNLGEYLAAETEVDAVVGYSMRQLCLEDPGNRLGFTQYTQPSLYVANSLCLFKARNDGVRPTYLAGHSLGEYNALLAAGVFDFMTGLRLTQKRGELMAQAKNGGMGAVLGIKAAQMATILSDCGVTSVDIANLNAPSQTVISGPGAELARLATMLEKIGGTYVPLQVSAAFHSRYMAEFAQSFSEFLRPFSFSVPQIPVIANVTAQPYPTDGGQIKELLVRQITQPVQWMQSVRYLHAHGVRDIREIGPGNILTRLVQQTLRDVQ